MILVAAQAIQGGSLISSDDIQQKEIPVTDVVKEYNFDTVEGRRALMGAMVKRNLGAGEALRSDDLMRPTDHGFMAAVLSPGMRAVTINVDAASGSSGLIWPGDRVDLILTQMNNDPGASLGRRISAHTVLSNVRVVAIDSQLISASNRNVTASLDAQNRTVTLEVDEEQAQRVSVGMRLGRLSVSVRASSTLAGNAKTESKREATFAEDVLPDLVEKPAPAPVAPVVVAAPPPPPPADPPMRVFSGPGEAKEFKF
jgi:pilus assembly protein CpaB